MSEPKHPSTKAVKAHRAAGEPLCAECAERLPHGTRNGYDNWGCRCETCRAAQAARKRRYHLANAETTRRYHRRYHRENAEAISERSRCYRRENAARTPAEVAAKRAELRPDGLKSCRVGPHLAPLAEFGVDSGQADGLFSKCHEHHNTAPGTWKHSRPLWEALGIDPFLCHYCGGRAWTAEHLLPRSHKGTDEIENLMPACGPCNYSRHNTPLPEYLDRRAALGLLTVFSPVLVAALSTSAPLAVSSPANPTHLRSPR